MSLAGGAQFEFWLPPVTTTATATATATTRPAISARMGRTARDSIAAGAQCFCPERMIILSFLSFFSFLANRRLTTREEERVALTRR